LTHLTYIGNNDCLKRFSSEISFNNNFFIINYDKENDCDELIKIFMELPEEMQYYYRFSDIKLFRPQNFSSFQRILLIFKPFICRNNLNDILLNIFKVNNFKILTRKTLVLNDDDSNYLYHHECPNENVSYKNYYHMMTDSKCEIVLLSKFRAFPEAHAILGSNNSVLTSNNGQSNNNFINIYSLINREISKLLEKNEINNLNLFSKKIRENLFRYVYYLF
jgi:nucleoside diphosphate kinase